jgi:hypothetical protein
MAMNGQVSKSGVIPLVLLVDLNPDQVRHYLGKPVVMVPLDPYDLHPPFGIREFSDVAEEMPVFFLEAAKIEIAKNIPEKDEATKGNRPQHLQGSLGTAHFRPQVQV